MTTVRGNDTKLNSLLEFMGYVTVEEMKQQCTLQLLPSLNISINTYKYIYIMNYINTRLRFYFEGIIGVKSEKIIDQCKYAEIGAYIVAMCFVNSVLKRTFAN